MDFRFYLVVVGLLHFNNSNAQIIAVEHMRLNYAYPQMSNPLKVLVEKEDCETITVKTDNGKITKLVGKERCQYDYVPNHIGQATLVICKVKNKDTIKIGEQKYRIKPWPKQEAYIGLKKSGSITRGEFLAIGGITVPIAGFDLTGELTVNSYKITVVRNGNPIFQLQNMGNIFQEVNWKKLEGIKSGDRIIISDIKLRMPGEALETTLEDIVVDIKDKS